jgi:hypothetical protein
MHRRREIVDNRISHHVDVRSLCAASAEDSHVDDLGDGVFRRGLVTGRWCLEPLLQA